MIDKKGVLFIVSGPSGVGKGTLLKETLKKFDNIFYSISMTTRKPRVGEIDGVDYHFVSEQDFHKAVEEGKMLEYAEYCTSCYGTPLEPVKYRLDNGIHVVLEIETRGMRIIRKTYPEAVKIFIVPPTMEILEKRIRGRGTEDEEKIKSRLKQAEAELAAIDEYDYVIISGDIEQSVSDLTKVFLSRINN